MITKSTILTLTQNGLNIFKHYIPFDFKLGKNFKNPFYDDRNASCNVYYDRHNQCFKIKDFGNPDYSGDCFAFAAQIKGLDVRRDFLQVLQSINRDLNLCLDEKPDNYIHPTNLKVKTKTFSQTQLASKPAAPTYYQNIKSTVSTIENTTKPFQYTEKDFSQNELDFWKGYGISEKTLNRFAVLSLSSFQSVNKDGDEYEIKNTEKEPIYSYKGADYIVEP